MPSTVGAGSDGKAACRPAKYASSTERVCIGAAGQDAQMDSRLCQRTWSMASGPSCQDPSGPLKRVGRAPCLLNTVLPTAKAGAKGGLQTPGPAAARGRARRRCSTRSRCQTASHLPASARPRAIPSQPRPRSHARSSPVGSKGCPDRQHSSNSAWGPPGEATLRDPIRHQLESAADKKGLPYMARA